MDQVRLGNSGLHVSRLCLGMMSYYNLLYREEEREMIPLCRDGGIGVLPWSPLARGRLAGTRTREGDRIRAPLSQAAGLLL